ncbi:MAG: recombinase family protein [Sphingomonadaceae bacterium]
MAKRGPRAAASGTAVAGNIRCAIYTRKSTDEGLDQEFNSLDAQREACAAYIVSQRHEGWTCLPDHYDDPGFSGGTMERPALKRLLADVEAGKVDVILVYKIDRLTRALADFARIVDVLDRGGASFVSITQAFNTTSSMGRLTLNVLLSFAQFEREVTAERIRDKIAASKKKGMWMGGPVPLGYEVIERKLIINEVEAETVRLIFARHQALRSLQALTIDLSRRGVRSKLRRMRDGRMVGGKAYSAGALGHLLRNRIYIGQIRHGDQVYPGEHKAILDQRLWDRSQQLLAANPPRPHTGRANLLSGLIEDGRGRRMRPEHAIKGDRRYRYYVSVARDDQEPAWRFPAGDIEAMVVQELAAFMRDPLRICAELGEAAALIPSLAERCEKIAATVADPTTCRETLERLGASVIVQQGQVQIALRVGAIVDLAGGYAHDIPPDVTISLSVPTSLKRRGHELRLVYPSTAPQPSRRDERLVRLLGSARSAWNELLGSSPARSPTRQSHLVRLARLRFLAPDIVSSILNGTQPVELTTRSLLRIADLPLDWKSQRQRLGIR